MLLASKNAPINDRTNKASDTRNASDCNYEAERNKYNACIIQTFAGHQKPRIFIAWKHASSHIQFYDYEPGTEAVQPFQHILEQSMQVTWEYWTDKSHKNREIDVNELYSRTKILIKYCSMQGSIKNNGIGNEGNSTAWQKSENYPNTQHYSNVAMQND